MDSSDSQLSEEKSKEKRDNASSKHRKRSLTSRLKDIIKRRSQESHSAERIYDITTEPTSTCTSPTPQHNHCDDHSTAHKPARPSSLFIQLGEEAARLEEDEQERRERMEQLLEEDYRRSWPLERLEALKLCLADPSVGKRSSVSEAVDRAKEHRRSLHEATPMPNVMTTSEQQTTTTTIDGTDDESDSSTDSD